MGFNTASGITQLQLLFQHVSNSWCIYCFNTASGITQLQLIMTYVINSKKPSGLFQYRKRYYPVATSVGEIAKILGFKFQYRKRYYPVATYKIIYSISNYFIVSIPQAVLPSCNDINKYAKKHAICQKFQYRKRYYPVATTLNSSAKLYVRETEFQYRKRYYPVATGSQFHV